MKRSASAEAQKRPTKEIMAVMGGRAAASRAGRDIGQHSETSDIHISDVFKQRLTQCLFLASILIIKVKRFLLPVT